MKSAFGIDCTRFDFVRPAAWAQTTEKPGRIRDPFPLRPVFDFVQQEFGLRPRYQLRQPILCRHQKGDKVAFFEQRDSSLELGAHAVWIVQSGGPGEQQVNQTTCPCWATAQNRARIAWLCGRTPRTGGRYRTNAALLRAQFWHGRNAKTRTSLATTLGRCFRALPTPRRDTANLGRAGRNKERCRYARADRSRVERDIDR